MIDAVMYGMIPSPKIVDWLNEPPEKMEAYFRNCPKPVAFSVAFRAASAIADWSTPASGIQNPIR